MQLDAGSSSMLDARKRWDPADVLAIGIGEANESAGHQYEHSDGCSLYYLKYRCSGT